MLKNQRLRELCEFPPQCFTETSIRADEAHGIQLHSLEAIHKVFLVDIIIVDNLGSLVPMATLRAILDSEGAPDRLASGSVQHRLLAGNADLELDRFHLGPIELEQKRERTEDGGKYYRQIKEGYLGVAILLVD